MKPLVSSNVTEALCAALWLITDSCWSQPRPQAVFVQWLCNPLGLGVLWYLCLLEDGRNMGDMMRDGFLG